MGAESQSRRLPDAPPPPLRARRRFGRTRPARTPSLTCRRSVVVLLLPESEAERHERGRRTRRRRRKKKAAKKRERKERKKNKRDERRERREHWVEVDSKRFRATRCPLWSARDCEEERVMESYGASCVCSRRWGRVAFASGRKGPADPGRSMARCMKERGFIDLPPPLVGGGSAPPFVKRASGAFRALSDKAAASAPDAGSAASRGGGRVVLPKATSKRT